MALPMRQSRISWTTVMDPAMSPLTPRLTKEGKLSVVRVKVRSTFAIAVQVAGKTKTKHSRSQTRKRKFPCRLEASLHRIGALLPRRILSAKIKCVPHVVSEPRPAWTARSNWTLPRELWLIVKGSRKTLGQAVFRYRIQRTVRERIAAFLISCIAQKRLRSRFDINSTGLSGLVQDHMFIPVVTPLGCSTHRLLRISDHVIKRRSVRVHCVSTKRLYIWQLFQ